MILPASEPATSPTMIHAISPPGASPAALMRCSFLRLSRRLRGKTTRQDAILGLVLTRAEGLPYSVIMTPSLAIPVRLAYLSTIVGDFQLPPLCTRSTGVPLPSASYVQ